MVADKMRIMFNNGEEKIDDFLEKNPLVKIPVGVTGAVLSGALHIASIPVAASGAAVSAVADAVRSSTRVPMDKVYPSEYMVMAGMFGLEYGGIGFKKSLEMIGDGVSSAEDMVNTARINLDM